MAGISNVGTASPPNDSASSFKRPSDAYSVTVTASGAFSMSVRVPLPERWSLAMAAQWDSPFARSTEQLASAAVGSVPGLNRVPGVAQGLGNMLSAVGITSRTKTASKQVWQDSTPFTLSIPLVLYAIDDPFNEVWLPSKKLMQLCAPTTMGDLLVPPGPNLTGGTKVSVQIGNILTITDCVAKSASCDYESILHTSGYPMTANVNFEIETWHSAITVADIDSFMG